MVGFDVLQANLDKANKELQNLTLEIAKAGGSIKDGKIIPPKKKLWVMESYFYAASQDESAGRYRIIRQIRELEPELVEQLKGLKGKSDEELKEFFLNFYEEHDDDLACGVECVEFGNGYIDEEDINYMTNYEHQYRKGNLLLEVDVSSDYGKWEGYMSFFEMEYDKFVEFEELDLEFKKCLTYN